MTTTKTATSTRETYVSKVSKLLSKAEGASTEAEAEAFFAKAQELISKWEIEEAELQEARAEAPSWKIIERRYPLSSYSPNQDSLAMQEVAKAMGLRGYQIPYRSGQKSQTVVLGTQEDLDRYEMMWTSINLQMTRFMRNQEDPLWDRNTLRRFRLGFKTGFGVRVAERIMEAREGTQRKTSTDLVLLGKADAIVQAMPQWLKTKNIKTNAAAAAAGRAAADKADINSRQRVRAAKQKAVTA